MGRLPQGRREVNPSREISGRAKGPAFGPDLGVSVPISFGLPIGVVGLFLLLTGVSTGSVLFGVLGGALVVLGALLFASGKRL